MVEQKLRFRFLILLVCLTLVIITMPFVADSDFMVYTVSFLYNILLFFTIYVLADHNKYLIYGLILALPSFIISFFNLYSLYPSLLVNIRLVSSLSVEVFVIIFLLRYIFKTKIVSLNIIYASICIYLLLGFAWSLGFSIIEFNTPGSFNNIKIMSNHSDIETVLAYYLNNFLYYSYITLTTLGYGNVYPITTAGNALAATEALTGQLYLTILIGRLLGLHIAQNNRI